MLYVMITFTILLSLFILAAIVYFCFPVKFLGIIFDRFPKKIYLFLVTFFCYLILIFSLILANNMWINTHCVSVDAIVTNSYSDVEKVSYGEDEFGHKDYEYREYYIITYAFEYEGETYQVKRTSSTDKTIGAIDTIKIYPNNPGEAQNNGFSFSIITIPMTLISIGGILIVLRIFIIPLIKSRKQK